MNSSASRFFIRYGLAVFLCAALHNSVALGVDRLRIGLSSFTPINVALWIAQDRGIFKKYGIDSEVVVGGASAGGVSSLIAGDVQFLAGASGGVINARSGSQVA